MVEGWSDPLAIYTRLLLALLQGVILEDLPRCRVLPVQLQMAAAMAWFLYCIVFPFSTHMNSMAGRHIPVPSHVPARSSPREDHRHVEH